MLPDPDFLVVTDWQMVRVADTHELNEHRNPGYDAAVPERWSRSTGAPANLCRPGIPLTRYASYGSRLRAALDRSPAWEVAMVADDLESYHNVWLRIHEDVLLTLGISRFQELES